MGWTQAGAAAIVPFGKIFSCFMASCLVGSTIFGKLQSRGVRTESSAAIMMTAAAVAMSLATVCVAGPAAAGPLTALCR